MCGPLSSALAIAVFAIGLCIIFACVSTTIYLIVRVTRYPTDMDKIIHMNMIARKRGS